MDLNKIMIVVFMVAVVAGAGFAVYMIVGGGDADDDDEKLATIHIKTALEVNDYVEFTNGRGDVVEKYTITEVKDGNVKTKFFNGKTETTKTFTVEQFYEDVMKSKSRYAPYLNVLFGKEVLDTSFGNISCNIYKGQVDNKITTFWVGSLDGICYKSQHYYTEAPATTYSKYLNATNLIITDSGKQPVTPTPGPEDPSKPNLPDTPAVSGSIKTPVSAGDNIELKVTGTNPHTDKYTVKEVLDGGKLKVELKRGTETITVTMFAEEFVGMLQPVLGGSTVDASVTDTTVKYSGKDVKCTVYVVKIPAGDLSSGNFIKKQMWVGADGIQYKSVSTLVNSNGGTVSGNSYTETSILGTTNMIVQKTVPAS